MVALALFLVFGVFILAWNGGILSYQGVRKVMHEASRLSHATQFVGVQNTQIGMASVSAYVAPEPRRAAARRAFSLAFFITHRDAVCPCRLPTADSGRRN